MSDLDTLARLHQEALEAAQEARDRSSELAAVVRAGAYALNMSQCGHLDYDCACHGKTGYTQQEIADACGVSRQRVQQWVTEYAPQQVYHDPTHEVLDGFGYNVVDRDADSGVAARFATEPEAQAFARRIDGMEAWRSLTERSTDD